MLSTPTPPTLTHTDTHTPTPTHPPRASSISRRYGIDWQSPPRRRVVGMVVACDGYLDQIETLMKTSDAVAVNIMTTSAPSIGCIFACDEPCDPPSPGRTRSPRWLHHRGADRRNNRLTCKCFAVFAMSHHPFGRRYSSKHFLLSMMSIGSRTAMAGHDCRPLVRSWGGEHRGQLFTSVDR